MTNGQIIELAEKTRKEKYCKKYIYKERGKQYCSLDCVFSDGNYGCRPQEYYTSFLDGFNAAKEYINQIPHFPLKNDSDIERIEKFRDNPELCQTYLREFKDNIECIINGILSREK